MLDKISENIRILEIHVGEKVYLVEKDTLELEDGLAVFVADGDRVVYIDDKVITAVVVE